MQGALVYRAAGLFTCRLVAEPAQVRAGHGACGDGGQKRRGDRVQGVSLVSGEMIDKRVEDPGAVRERLRDARLALAGEVQGNRSAVLSRGAGHEAGCLELVDKADCGRVRQSEGLAELVVCAAVKAADEVQRREPRAVLVGMGLEARLDPLDDRTRQRTEEIPGPLRAHRCHRA